MADRRGGRRAAPRRRRRRRRRRLVVISLVKSDYGQHSAERERERGARRSFNLLFRDEEAPIPSFDS